MASMAAALVSPVTATSPTAPPTSATAGLFFRGGGADVVFAAPVLSSDIDIDITADIARVTVIQRFRNPSKVWLEGIYVFPLPERSAVDRLRLRVGERTIEGRILGTAEAEQAYQVARAAGRRASLLSSARANVFSTKVANIGPGEEVIVEISYQDQVPFADGEWSYRFPLVVAPRYTPAAGLPLVAFPPPRRNDPQSGEAPSGVRPIAQDAKAGHGRDLFGPVRHPDRGAVNPVSLAVSLNAGVPIADIVSSGHKVDVERADDASARVVLAAGPVPADRDFVLTWRPVPADGPRLGLFAEARDGATHLLVSLLPPDGAIWRETGLPRDLVLVIDKSGSMHGPAIGGARAAAGMALRRLTPRDRFNLIAFDDETRRLFDDVVPATAGNVQHAFAALASLEAEGGTEMAGALDAALQSPAPDGRLRQVVFLTDGAVSNEAWLAELIESRLGSTRLFTVGVGAAPNAHFMRRAAEAGRGTFTYIDRVEDVVPKMTALHAKLERPALTDIRLAWDLPGGATPEVYPATIPDLYIGDPVSFGARIPDTGDNELAGRLTVSGRLGDRPWSTALSLDGARDAAGVAAVWGRSKVADLRNAWPVKQPDWEAMRKSVLDTALAYRLVTEFTSLVAIDESEIARPRDEAVETAEIERNLAHGMDYEKVFGGEAFGPRGMAPVPTGAMQDAAFRRAIAIPSTATPGTAMLAGGATLLLAGVLVLVVVRRWRAASC
jgi:Ca-activated chloride channel family protein